jgi:hypothetical protein
VICASRPLPLAAYAATIGDPKFVIDMIVGDTQRVIEYPMTGFAEHQEVPVMISVALARLIDGGFTSRIIRS